MLYGVIMARKAVQGYPEKSYYDNTRYLGIVATTDPLNEGLFKHMVNFDVSDTGQSVKPREGFLTTTIKQNPQVGQNIISISNETVIYKDNTIGEYILYDFNNHIAYIADVSAYNVSNYFLPIESQIANYDWTDVFKTVLIPQLSYVKSYYLSSTLAGTITNFLPMITPIPDTKVEHIYDENGINKTLVKVRLIVAGQSNFDFIIQLRYRKNAVGDLPADTLIVDGLPYMFEHPTYVPTDRNLAVSKSIIPSPFQTLYTQATRPDGHISNLGSFMYVYNDQNQYVINYILRNINYNIKPYFTLNPAYYELNNAVNNSDKWAYKFELFNTGYEVGDNSKTPVFSSPWMKYQEPSIRPTPLFSVAYNNNISLTNADRSDNHYKGAKYAIFIISKNPVVSTSSKVYNGGFVETYPGKEANGDFTNYNTAPYFFNFSTFKTVQDAWLVELNKAKSKETLISVIETISANALFYVYNLNNAPATDLYSAFDETFQSSNNLNTESYIIEKDNDVAYSSLFLTGTQLIDRIKTEGIFTTNKDVVFKLLPFSSQDTRLEATLVTTFTSPTQFDTQAPYYVNSSLALPDVSNFSINTYVQTKNNGNVYKLNLIPPNTKQWQLQSASYSAITMSFIKNTFYYDDRLKKYYKWNLTDGAEGALTPIDQPPSAQFITQRWFFAELNYWNENGLGSGASNVYVNYLPVYNIMMRNTFPFIKYDFDARQYILTTDINTLKTNTNAAVTNFTASANFGEQPPWYVSSIPSFSAALNTTVHVITTAFGVTISYIYRQETSPSGNNWVNISSPSVPTAFVQGTLYKDTTTGYTYRWDNVTGLAGKMTPVGIDQLDLNELNFFNKGLNGIFYIRPYKESEITNKTYGNLETLKIVWNATSFTQTFNLGYGYDSTAVTYIDEVLDFYPAEIQSSHTMTIFENNRILLWNKHILYISEEGRFYWFKERNRIEFSEEIVKVLQYKQIILVFTTQHLYAVYRVETTVTQLNPATNQIEQNVTGFVWSKQIVLYNLLVNKKYADVIQIFNQMVLFYSEDGQLFMIRPSSQIDDQTRFSVQYFNKAANDILEHYDEYINERLASYGSYTRITKDQVKIKALVSLNFIKLIYYVPNVITYMLIYDVLNNRYTAHDSLTFTDVYDKMFVESGELFVTQQNNKLLFTMPYVEVNTRDNHADMTYPNNFKKEGINCLIDTGNLNLNNHLYKRFRDLHVVFKNLNSSNVLFNVETMVDEIIARPFYNMQLEVQEAGNKSYFVSVPKANDKDLIELVDVNQISETATSAVREALLQYSLTNNLFENNNILMDFSQYTSSKLLTHRTSILGYGKVFRIKLQFISKGSYKLQHFGIIYKERRV